MDENENTQSEEQETGAKPDELGEAGKRALAAERKARAAAEKRARELEDKVKAAEDAEKTEVERLQGQVATMTKTAEAAQARAERFEVAAAKGLTLAQARRLVGSTKDELEEDADAMRAELGLNDDGKTEKEETGTQETGRPREDLKPGASNAADETPDAAKLADSILSSAW